MSQARDYVNNHFTTEEKFLFNYMLEAFPESILVQNGVESEDILAVIGVITKALGNARELILNLQTSHSLEELYDKISEGYLKANNEALLLLLLKDLNVSLFINKTDKEILDLITNNPNLKNLILNSYLLKRDRGTTHAIKSIISSVIYGTLAEETEIEESARQVNIIINSTGLFNEIDSVFDAERSLYNLSKDNDVYKTLMFYRPAGTLYNIVIKYIVTELYNEDNDAVLSPLLQTVNSRLEHTSISDLTTASMNITNTVYEVLGGRVVYQITVSNPHSFVPLKFYLYNSIDSNITNEIIKPSMTKTLLGYKNVSTLDGSIKGHFKNQYNDNVYDATSNIWSKNLNTFTNVTLDIAGPALSLNAQGTILYISNTNKIPIIAKISEKWYITVGGEDYLYLDTSSRTKEVQVDKQSVVSHAIINPSMLHNLKVIIKVEFK